MERWKCKKCGSVEGREGECGKSVERVWKERGKSVGKSMERVGRMEGVEEVLKGIFVLTTHLTW